MISRALTFIMILVIIKTAVDMRASLIILIFAASTLSVKVNAITSSRFFLKRCATIFVLLICSAALLPIQIGKGVIRRTKF